MNVVPISLPVTEVVEEPAKRRWIRRRSRVLAAIFLAAFYASVGVAFLLAGALVFYDGPFLSFGAGGIWFGQESDIHGLLPLTAFSTAQRLAGAMAVILLISPVTFVLFNLERIPA